MVLYRNQISDTAEAEFVVGNSEFGSDLFTSESVWPKAAMVDSVVDDRDLVERIARSLCVKIACLVRNRKHAISEFEREPAKERPAQRLSMNSVVVNTVFAVARRGSHGPSEQPL